MIRELGAYDGSGAPETGFEISCDAAGCTDFTVVSTSTSVLAGWAAQDEGWSARTLQQPRGTSVIADLCPDHSNGPAFLPLTIARGARP